MSAEHVYQWLADIVLFLHTLLVLFVVGGLISILIGNLMTHWRWVNRLTFRLAHLATIAIVTAESWFSMVCPLTSLEMWLRERAHESTYGGGFIEHWLQRFLYYEAPPWVFALVYTLFGALVVLTWTRFPPVRSHRDRMKER